MVCENLGDPAHGGRSERPPRQADDDRRRLNLATSVAILFVCISVRARAETPLQKASSADRRGDYVTELQLVRPLAEQHNPIAETLLGFLYYHGRAGLPQDYAGAAKWFGRASDDGEIHGEAMLGTLYLNGQGVPRDRSKARSLVVDAARKGDAESQRVVGSWYEDGNGVARDYAESARWYEKAAAQGNSLAQLRLGLLYLHGHGVPKDDTLCAGWVRKAAEQGNGYAESALGGLYLTGQGVPLDRDAAGYWLEKAADQGGFSGDWARGIQLWAGVGVKQDLVEAYRLMSFAMTSLDEEKRAKLQPQVEALAKSMTPAQIAEAKRRTLDSMPRPDKGQRH
jgi:TPR repeat protein